MSKPLSQSLLNPLHARHRALVFAYRAVWLILAPILLIFWLTRLYDGKEDRQRWRERFGLRMAPRQPGRLVWFHGASVGEVLSILPLIAQLQAVCADESMESAPQTPQQERERLQVLLTSGTKASAELARKKAPHLQHQYLPFDAYPCVRRFLRHWQPELAVFVESEFWPEFITQTPHIVLINGRISDRSWPKYQRFSWFLAPLLGKFAGGLTQRLSDTKRLKKLGLTVAKTAGNLKFDAPPLGVDPDKLLALQDRLAESKVLVAASTHPGEDEQIAAIHHEIAKQRKNLLTIIVPRHPERGADIALMLGCPRRGNGDPVPPAGLYVADTLGELGLWYRLADAAIVGGSLVEHVGGHNPLEPLKLGTPTFTGPFLHNYKDMIPILTGQEDLLVIAQDLSDLTEHVRGALRARNQAKREKLATTLAGFSGATAAALALVQKQLKLPTVYKE